MPGKVDKFCDENAQHNGDITCINFESGNGLVYSGGEDGKIKIFDKDLNLKKTLNHHDAYICALAVNSKGKLYSVSYDGAFKIMENPHKSNYPKDFQVVTFPVLCMYVCGERLCLGDDSGVVKIYLNDNMQFQFKPVEAVQSVAIENHLVYAVKDKNVVITEIVPGKPTKLSEIASIPGRYPLCLAGPIVENCRSFLAFCTKSGKGVNVFNNTLCPDFQQVWNKEDCHTDEINSICGTEQSLFTAGKDGFVKMWGDIDKGGKLVGEVDVGRSVTAICNGPTKSSVYAACSDGVVRRVVFVE